MSEIKFDPNNYRIHTDKNKRIIRKSIEECGAGRSVLVDKDNVLIAGNGVYEQAKELGLSVKVIETDGKELVVVKRTDLSSNDEKRKLLALADNHSSDTSMFDLDLVIEDFDLDVLKEFEFDTDNFTISKDDIDKIFSDDFEKRPEKQKELICPHCGKNVYEKDDNNI